MPGRLSDFADGILEEIRSFPSLASEADHELCCPLAESNNGRGRSLEAGTIPFHACLECSLVDVIMRPE